MNILFDARTVRTARTGVGNYAYCLLKHLASLAPQLQHQLTAIFLENNVPADLAGCQNLRIIEVDADYEHHPSGEIWENSTLVSLAGKLNTDILHGPAFLIPWRRNPFKKVVSIHDLISFKCPGNYPPAFQTYLKFIIRRSVNAADRIIADSFSTQNDIVSLLKTNPDKIDVIHLGTGEPFRLLTQDELDKARENLQIPDKFILFVSNFEPRKNHSLLLKALSILKRQFSFPHKLVLIGQPAAALPQFQRLLDSLYLQDEVLLVDYITPEQLAVYYNLAELFVFPSTYEGFGLPLLEAMACGTPIIAIKNSSVPEVVADVALLLPPSTDAPNLADQITHLVSNTRIKNDLVHKGLVRAKSFSWQLTASKTFDTYSKIAP